MRFFSLYQFLAPAIFVPLSYWLWWRRYDGRHDLVFLLWSMPVLFAYVVPGIGTNVLGLWEINTRLRLGKFRPHHGFVFGSATSMLTLMCLERKASGIDLPEVLRAGVILGSILGFWNWFYDIEAIRAGFIRVYNRPYAQGLGAEAIAMEYAPFLFGSFGFCYGAAIRIIEWTLLQRGGWSAYWILLIASNLCVLAVPVTFLILCSWFRTGTAGLIPLKRDNE